MPSKEVVKKVLRSIKRRSDYDYFFTTIESPDWILPLREYGLFSSPPPVEKDGDYLQHLSWPESKYLMRMAEQAPAEVTETIIRIPETDNERVHEDYVQAAINMPLDNAFKIAKNELKWIKSQEHFYFLYPSYVGQLISYLAKNRKNRLAEDIAKTLLDLKCTEREVGRPEDEWYQKSSEIVAKFSDWEFGRVLTKNIPDLIEVSGFPPFEMLCQLLEKAMNVRPSNDELPNDYSWIWRRSIEDHEQNRGSEGDIRSLLVDVVRDAALQLVAIDEENLLKIVTYLDAKPLLIFNRISIYLLSQYSNIKPELVALKLTDHELFEDSAFRKEYAQLALAGFCDLSLKQQEKILSWIEAGPDLVAFKSSVLANTGREVTDDEIQIRIKVWQRDRLVHFKDCLAGNWKKHYESLVLELGEAEHPEFSSYSTSWVGPTSPIGVDELEQMSVDEIVFFIKEWVPPENDMDDSPEGLGRTLAVSVSDKPIHFATKANLFKELDPTYVRALFDGLREAPKNHAELPWEPVLELCWWVVNQSREIPERKSEYSDIDPGWMWTRKSIAKLLSNGVKNVPGEIHIELRPKVWRVLLLLTDDPDPMNEEYGEGHMDPSTQSINTVRGEAMHAVINFALWVYRHIGEENKPSFEQMQEVRSVLNKHLDVEIDPSLAIRSVYAQWFPWLNLMDNAWAEQTKEKIFSPESSQYWDTAWKTYITFCQPYDDVLAVLRNQYALAIDKIGQPSIIEIDMANADKCLAEHLMTYYWRGKLDISDPLVQSFYAQATNVMKRRAIEFLGRNLRNIPTELPTKIHERLKSLWSWRYQEAIRREELDELAEYCWWFSSGKMETDWAITQLKLLLNLPVKLDALSFVAEELVKQISEKPLEVLECLNLMLNHLGTKGIYFGWNDEAKQILSTAINQKNNKVTAQATSIIHRLGAMGYFEFRSLL